MKKILLVVAVMALASQVIFAQRVLINKGDQYVGAKLALGSVGGASMGYIGEYEMGFQENIGIGATVGYSGYSEEIAFFSAKGEWSYTNIYIVANGNYHYDLLNNEKIDTWAALHVGYNAATVKWAWTSGTSLFTPAAATAGGVVIGLSANARYFVSDKLAVSARLGFGLGIVNIGVDYKL